MSQFEGLINEMLALMEAHWKETSFKCLSRPKYVYLGYSLFHIIFHSVGGLKL